jgi:putative ATP-dependent endonuclease of the OLD family
MKIESVRIQNFRSFHDETVEFDDYTCLVGPNGSGKSTVLTALNIFFRETENVATNLVELGREDFHQYKTEEPIQITVTFTNLNPDAQEELKAYVRQGKLIVSAVAQWNEKSQSAQVLQFGERLGIQEFRQYFEMDKAGAKAPELQKFYSEDLRSKFPALPAVKVKGQMEEALKTYESSNPELCSLIPSEDQFYGVSRGANRIEKYLQWVYVPAVKDAVSEQAETKTSAIGKLLARRVHAQLSLDGPVEGIKQEALAKYKELLASHESLLKDLSTSLNKRFQQWAHHDASLDLQWQDQGKAVSIAKPTAEVKAIEGLFKGDLARFGHGLQRSFIFALLEEASECKDDGPRLVLGCEEPELYQHPPQARHLAAVLQRLSSGNAEVMVCTHSPYFVSGRSFENVRLACKAPDGSVNLKRVKFENVATAVATVTGDIVAKPGGMAAKIDQEMESPVNEMFFSGFRVFVEGLEDVAYINSYLSLLDKWDEFRSLGGHIIPVQGKNHLVLALAIANEFKLPYYVVFDCDGDTPEDDPARPTGRRNQHKKENTAIFRLAGVETPEPFPEATVMTDGVAAWPTKLSDIIKVEIGNDKLGAAKDRVRNDYGINVADMEKNGLFIGYTMATAWEQGHQSATLSALCEEILKTARKTRPLKAEDCESAESVQAAN